MHRWMIGMICCRDVHARAERVAAGFVGAKQALFRQPGARFASVASIIGALDPMADRTALAAPLMPPPVPTLVLGGHAMPRTTRAKVQAIPSGPGVQVPGSPGLHEELTDAIGKPVAAFPSA